MGSSVIDDVASCEGRVKAAEQHLKAQQMNKETAKKSSNYKNASTSYVNGKLMKSYDANIYYAKEALKKAKADLANAKKKR